MAPVNQSFEARMRGIEQAIGSLAGTFNPQRERLASDSARGLTDSRLVERAGYGVADRAADGSVAYKLDGQYEGQAYRDARTGIANQANASGTAQGSAAGRATRQAMSQLQNQQAGLMRAFATQQSGITDQQAQARRGFDSDMTQARGDYTQWQNEETARLAEVERQKAWEAAQTRYADTASSGDAAANAAAAAPDPTPAAPAAGADGLIRLGANRTRAQANALAARQGPGWTVKQSGAKWGGGYVLKRS